MKKVTRIICMMAFFLAAMMGMSTVSSAATVGDSITEPEDGWKRIDDTDKSVFTYSGTWFAGVGPGNYNGSVNHTNTVNSKCSFNFYGTKLRIIVAKKDYSKNVSIKIDGVEAFYSVYNSSLLQRCIAYEKTGLTLGNHTVVITNTDGVVMNIDAIDIDSFDIIGLKAVSGNKNATLNWNQVNAADSYIIRYGTSPDNLTESKTVSASDYDGSAINGLTNGTKYYFTVTAVVGGTERTA